MNIESKHTPAPWEVVLEDDCYYIQPINESFIVLSSNDLANAHLISAAPEAIEFIADLVNKICTRKITDGDLEDFVEKAEPILKKAYNL